MDSSRAWCRCLLALGLCLGTTGTTPAAKAPLRKRPSRVLLFASAPMREYQFLRTVLVRQSERNRADLTIHLQLPPGVKKRRAGVVQDVPSDRLLEAFPDRLERDPGKVQYDNLGSYDVIVAFDPDWSQLSKKQWALLAEWVRQGGGLILVAGPVNMRQLGRPAAAKTGLGEVLDLLPVVVGDGRLAGAGRPTDKPWRLHFPDRRAPPAFLKLDAAGKGPLAGWEEFFGGKKGESRGFYNFYPVRKVKPAATVLATFADPKARLADGTEQPYLVTMPFGKGRVAYLASAEWWRLRQYRDEFHERFWNGLVAYARSSR